MDPAPQPALLLGSTGLIGRALRDLLLAHSPFHPLTALVRRPSGLSHPHLVEIVSNFADLDALPPPVTLFCSLGTTLKAAGSPAAFRRIDYEIPLRLAQWARRHGAQHLLLVSSIGADPHSSNLYLRVKGELERDLAALNFPSLDIFQPSVLLGPRPALRPAEWISQRVLKALPFLLPGPLRPYRATPAATVAAAMAAAARSPLPGLRRHRYDEILNLAARAT